MLKNWQTLTRCFNEKLCKQQIFLNFLFQQFFGYKIWATWAENIYFFIQIEHFEIWSHKRDQP